MIIDRRSFAAADMRTVRERVQTTTSTWVFAPRLMANAPATGQRSTSTDWRVITGRNLNRAREIIMRADPLFDDRRDPPPPFGAVEDAVMAHVGGEMIFLERVRQVRRDLQRGLESGRCRNIVMLALDRQQGNVGDRAGDRPACRDA